MNNIITKEIVFSNNIILNLQDIDILKITKPALWTLLKYITYPLYTRMYIFTPTVVET